jgi:CRISPR-associated protein Csy1
MATQIIDFFNERKAAWLKTKLTDDQTEDEKAVLNQEANERFNPKTWLPDAAKRASQLSMVSHPSKFSHPSAKTSSVIAAATTFNDGYLRSGNVFYELDVFGNAAAMDVYKFLTSPTSDGRNVLAHFESDSEEIKGFVKECGLDYVSIKEEFLLIKRTDGGQNKTDRLVKQVYFPVDDGYHLLSLLTPSGLLTKIKTTVDDMRFSDNTKAAKEARKKSEYHPEGFDDVLDLTVTGYGGTQPQNVSVLNSKNAGKAYLFASVPPDLMRREVRLPKTDFFINTLNPKVFNDSFQNLHRLMRTDVNNINVRQGITNVIRFVIDEVLTQVFKIRAQGVGWSKTEYYKTLPLAQRIWLDDAHIDMRAEREDWFAEISRDFARWVLKSYTYNLKNQQLRLSDFEAKHIENEVRCALETDKEYFS